MRFRASREPIQIWPFSSLAARMCALVPLTSMSRITCRGQSRPCSRRLPSWGNDSARAATSATGSLNWLSWMSTCSRPCCRDSTPFSGTPTTWNVTRPVSMRGLMWAFWRKRSRARSTMGSRASRDCTSLWVSTQPASPEKAATLSPGATFTQPGTWAWGRQDWAKGRQATTAAAEIRMAAVVACLPFAQSCRPQAHVPGWVKVAPGDSVAAFSGEAGWVLTHKDVQSLLARDPMVERALDLFLQKAHINPRIETGRVTFHVVGVPGKGDLSLQQGLEHVLIQLNQFKDPVALVAALAESFPQEGSLRLQGRDWPLYVILDVEVHGIKAHIRAASDEKGQIWIGSLEALSRMAAKASLDAQPDVALAAEWISPRAPFQGYLQPEALIGGLRKSLDVST